jgi:hypothetical protein
MFGNGTKRKLLDLNFLVLIENVSFRSRILFPKRIYLIFFGTKAAKRKLPILKEHWFDIAKRHVEKDNDRHGPRRIPKYSQPLDLPNFSLPSTFKAITYSTLQ